MTTFRLNGVETTVSSDHPHLLAALREEAGALSVKDGCAPSGQCGCCTVLVDGEPKLSCALSMEKVEGRAITTLDGLVRMSAALKSCAPNKALPKWTNRDQMHITAKFLGATTDEQAKLRKELTAARDRQTSWVKAREGEPRKP